MTKTEKALLLLFITVSQCYFSFATVGVLEPESNAPEARKVIMVICVVIAILFTNWQSKKGN